MRRTLYVCLALALFATTTGCDETINGDLGDGGPSDGPSGGAGGASGSGGQSGSGGGGSGGASGCSATSCPAGQSCIGNVCQTDPCAGMSICSIDSMCQA